MSAIAPVDQLRLALHRAGRLTRKLRLGAIAGPDRAAARRRRRALAAPDRPARSAHRRPDHRRRNLWRPLRLRRPRRGDRAANRPSTSARPPRTGCASCIPSAGSGICAPPTRRSRAPMRAPSSRTGWRCTAGPAARSSGTPKSPRGARISFLAQSPLILHDADHDLYRDFVRSLLRHASVLRAAIGSSEPGLPRMHAAIAIALIGLSLSQQERLARAGPRPHRRGAAGADPSRRRPHLAQSGRAGRDPGRPAAAPAGADRARPRALRDADELDRPDDADAALLPARRRRLRAFQRRRRLGRRAGGDRHLL